MSNDILVEDDFQQQQVSPFTVVQEPLMPAYLASLPAAKPLISHSIKPHEETLRLRGQFERRQLFLQLSSKHVHNEKLFKPGHTLEQGYMFSNGAEGCNLLSVTRKGDCFNLTIKPDLNSRDYTQWFYFMARGLPPHPRFIVGPFLKPKSLFSQQMKLAIKQGHSEWKRGGKDFNYFKMDGFYYLNFVIPQIKTHSTVQIAYCFPYSYTDLVECITQTKQKASLSGLSVRCEVIGKSVLGNNIYMLGFSRATSNKFAKITTTNVRARDSSKPVILVMARVHPSETVSSYIMKGIIDTLLKSSPSIKLLCERFQIKLIPMINPDGVVLGNGRYSASGADLNRRWEVNSSRLFPELLCIKEVIRSLKGRISMLIDLHGHSRKRGVFFYGCEKNRTDKAVREFPYLMAHMSNNFVYKYNCFKVEKDRAGTARVYFKQMLKIPTVYTLECSFGGSQNSGGYNYTVQDLQRIGAQLIDGFCTFYSQQIDPDHKLQKLHKENLKARQRFDTDPGLFNNDEDDSGSQSNPSEGRNQDLLSIIESDSLSKIKHNSLVTPELESSSTFRDNKSQTHTLSQRERAQSVLTNRLSSLKKSPKSPGLITNWDENKRSAKALKNAAAQNNTSCKVKSFDFDNLDPANTNRSKEMMASSGNVLHGRAPSNKSCVGGLLVEYNGMKKHRAHPSIYDTEAYKQQQLMYWARKLKAQEEQQKNSGQLQEYHGSSPQYMRLRKLIERTRLQKTSYRQETHSPKPTSSQSRQMQVRPMTSFRKIQLHTKAMTARKKGRSLSQI